MYFCSYFVFLLREYFTRLDFTVFTPKLQRCMSELNICELFNYLRETTNISITKKNKIKWLQNGLCLKGVNFAPVFYG